MSYRGEDLDLRTPQSRQSREPYAGDLGMNGTRPRTPSGNGRGGETLYVDDTVLACCNHAYDVAHAHGANEVRLEHLVHALTRVEAAAEILEQRGIREAHLRRESAAVIASEIPVGLSHSHGAPRSSVEFEDVLRRASDQGRSRAVAASVHDMLWVLLNYNREIPAIALLLRHARDWQTWDWPHRETPRRETGYTERRAYAEPAPPPPRQQVVERIVEVPRAEPQPQMTERVVEIPRAESRTVYTQQVNLDPVHSRLDHMEQSLRQIQNSVATERRAMAETVRDMLRESMREMMREVQREISNMPRGNGASLPAGFVDDMRDGMREMQREIANLPRNGAASLPVGFIERVETIDRTLTERLGTLERAVQTGTQEGARNWASFGDRLKVIDKLAVMSPSTDLGEALTQHLTSITTQVQSVTEKLQGLDMKLRTLDESVGASRRDTTGTAQLISEKFQGVRQQLDQQNLSTASLVAQLTEPVTERMRLLESNLQRQLETFANRPVDTGVADRVERTLADRLGRLEQAIAATQQSYAQGYQLTAQVGERVNAIESYAASQPQTFQGLATKLAHIEQLVQSHGDRGVQYMQQVAQQTADAQTRELADVKEGLVKLGSNQSTLSEMLDQWRTESQQELAIVSNQVKGLEEQSLQPTQMLRQMATDIHGLQRVTIADYDQNRRGIRNWLFGTEDLFAGAWRDETRQIRERIAQAREDRAERKA